MLFVDDEETKVLYRREDSRAGADHDARFPAADAIPLLGALIGCERGVQEGARWRRRRNATDPPWLG